jgi:hypothetical protein
VSSITVFEPVQYADEVQQPMGQMVVIQGRDARGFYLYLRHRNFSIESVKNFRPNEFEDMVFMMRPGLAGAGTVSFESINVPSHYLRHQNYRIKLHRIDGSDLFRMDASFRITPGLADSSQDSLESVNFPGYFLHMRNNAYFIDRGDSPEFRKQCTFKILSKGIEEELKAARRLTSQGVK